MPRGVRDEEFHTAVCELLSDWGSTVATPEGRDRRDVPIDGWTDGIHPVSLATTVPGVGASVVPLVHAWLDPDQG